MVQLAPDRAIERRSITVTVNGRKRAADVETRLTLGDFLREELDLLSVHLGCEHGVCGVCTVLVDGRSVRSCLMFAVQADGHEVETVEHLSHDPRSLHPIQEAFTEQQGLQCGFCTPAMILRTKELLDTDSDVSQEDQIREAISGIMCRCTGYQNIIRAIQAAGEKLRSRQPASQDRD
jgi:aerobic-type carbon monoxide dehydrogenase small subunit (CoxS/CutS family)